jgi:hypothetical protein
MATTDLYSQFLNPVAPEIMGLERQRAYAKMLMAQSAQPQGQMVSGQFVAPSWTQQLNAALNPVIGAYLSKSADTEATKLAKQLRQRYADETQQYQDLLRGKEATPAKYTEMAGPFGEGVGQGNTNIPMPISYTPAQAAIPADPQAAYLFGSTAYNPVLQQVALKKLTEGPKWEKASFTDEKTGRVREGVIDVNSSDPISTFRVGGVKPEMTAYERSNLRIKTAELADKGIGVNLGGDMSQTVVPQVGMPQGQMGAVSIPKADAKFAPSQIEQYIPDPSLTGEQNRAAAAEFNKKLRTNIENAKDTFGILKSATEILGSGAPSSGRLENIVTGTGEFFGVSGKASQADAQLKILGAKATAKVPRFEGPQSDKDTALYQAAAGDLGNPNIPIQSRLAAAQTMIELNKKYYPNADWDSINVTGPVTKKNVLGGTRGLGAQTMSPNEFKKTLPKADQEAFDWATKNPNDPRAAQIRNRLGI